MVVNIMSWKWESWGEGNKRDEKGRFKKGYSQVIVHRNNKGQFAKGHRHLPSERKEKIIKRLLGNKFHLGHKHTDETKLKISRATKGKPKPKVSLALKGIKRSLEFKKKVSEGMKGKRNALGNKNHLGIKHSEETKNLISEKIRRLWEEGKYRDRKKITVKP